MYVIQLQYKFSQLVHPWIRMKRITISYKTPHKSLVQWENDRMKITHGNVIYISQPTKTEISSENDLKPFWAIVKCHLSTYFSRWLGSRAGILCLVWLIGGVVFGGLSVCLPLRLCEAGFSEYFILNSHEKLKVNKNR